MGNKKHEHKWEVKDVHYTSKPSAIKCKICHKVSFPGKQAGIKSNRGCFGNCHQEVSSLTEVKKQRKATKLQQQNG